MSFPFKSSTQRIMKNKELYGFDIETFDNNKQFLCASIVGNEYEKVFFSKEEFILDIKKKRFDQSMIIASNLAFDFFGIFFGTETIQKCKTLFRGSDLLYSKTYIDHEGEFHSSPKNKRCKRRIFIDSYNYIKMSVEKMGNIINIPKGNKPDFLGEEPNSKIQWDEMIKYNIQDSVVTYKFCEFLFAGFEKLGATVKNTVASTSMSLFRNKYLKMQIFQPNKEILIEQFESYYGGRTEAFKRGAIKNANYYDINSLYPSVMHDMEFPDPNSLRITYKNTVEFIRKFKGISKIKINVPDNIKIPPLPIRTKTKLIFPTGTLSGWWTHDEILNAESVGCVIMEVHKTHYFTKTCKPFKDYVSALYKKRMEYKALNSPMELIVKLMLNSLYGKFGQKFIGRENYVPIDSIKLEEIEGTFERIGDYARIKCDSEPSAFCIPIWATYVTSYARIKLYELLKDNDPIYCDTDSIITYNELPTSKKLGKLKLEMTIKEGVIIRPKFYGLLSSDNEEYVKIKGLGKRLNYLEFTGLISKPLFGLKSEVHYTKFAKFKESLRRHVLPNEILDTSKNFGLQDSKRNWLDKDFDMFSLQESKPIIILEE